MPTGNYLTVTVKIQSVINTSTIYIGASLILDEFETLTGAKFECS
jgi:hypothetical protein